MTIDLTLDGLRVPAIDGYNPPFGHKIERTELNRGGLSTREVNENMMMPFSLMRPKTVEEDSVTTAVEYDAKLVFTSEAGTTPSAGHTLTMGSGTYVGCTVTFTNLLAHTCTVRQSDGTTTLFSVPAGKTMAAMWNGTAWLWTTAGSVMAGDPTPVSSAAVHAAIGTSDGSIARNTSNTTSIGEIFVRKFGKIAMFHCNLEGCQLKQGEIITFATVSEGFRPSSYLQWALVDADFVLEGLRAWVSASGEIQILSPQTGTQTLRLQSVYFTD